MRHFAFDNAGSRSLSEYARVLTPEAMVVIVGGPMANRLIGPLGHVIKLRLAGTLRRRRVTFFIAKLNKPDMAMLAGLLESGPVRSVVEKRYELSQTADALAYMGEGHAQGKLVVTL